MADDPLSVTVTTPQRPVVRVEALGGVGVLAAYVPGAQGPAGPQGERGEQGPPARFGQLRVADMAVDPEDSFPANVRQQLKFVPNSSQTQDFLRDPFRGVAWTDNRIVPRPDGYGDWQDIIVNLLVVPEYAGGRITADLDVGTGGPVQTANYSLRGSGVSERATFRLGTQTLTGFLANGAAIYLTGTVPFVIQSESVVYLPISTGPST